MNSMPPMPNGRGKSRAATLAIACYAMTAAFTLFGSPGDADAKPPLGKKWPISQQVSFDRIDHSAYDRLLQKYVDLDGYVAYAAWKSNRADRGALVKYLANLSRANPALPSSAEGRLAFWINAYNAVTIEGILQEYPTTSIRNHTARVFGYNIWQDLPLQVGSDAYALETIEHEILRKLNEPRMHFAIVCASVGCPRLLNEAYTGQGLEQQLSDNTLDFFSRPQNLRADAAAGKIYLSTILDWFGSDFGSSQSEQFRYLSPFFPNSAQQAIKNPRIKVGYLDYDWSLNDQSRKK